MVAGVVGLAPSPLPYGRWLGRFGLSGAFLRGAGGRPWVAPGALHLPTGIKPSTGSSLHHITDASIPQKCGEGQVGITPLTR